VTTSKFFFCLLCYMGRYEPNCCHFGKAVARGSPMAPCLGFTDPHRATLDVQTPGRARSAGRALCSRPPGTRLQIFRSQHSPGRLSSARKLLLIKPVRLITGCSIKYFSRCFRCSLRVLVKAGEASDQECWPCEHCAPSPPAWTSLSPSTAQSGLSHLLCCLSKA
jgi:hypothetical protein